MLRSPRVGLRTAGRQPMASRSVTLPYVRRAAGIAAECMESHPPEQFARDRAERKKGCRGIP